MNRSFETSNFPGQSENAGLLRRHGDAAFALIKTDRDFIVAVEDKQKFCYINKKYNAVLLSTLCDETG